MHHKTYPTKKKQNALWLYCESGEYTHYINSGSHIIPQDRRIASNRQRLYGNTFQRSKHMETIDSAIVSKPCISYFSDPSIVRVIIWKAGLSVYLDIKAGLFILPR